MYVFKETLCDGDASSQGASMWISLTKSFPKGEKGKYGKLVEILCEQGSKEFYDFLEFARDVINEEDKGGLEILMEDVGPDAFKLIEKNLTNEEHHTYRNMQ